MNNKEIDHEKSQVRSKPPLFVMGLILLPVISQFWACRPDSAKDRPNVVLVLVDALRPDKLGCYGFPEEISPEIDEMAEKGVRFNEVICQCSWTRPSVGSLMTSLYPRTLGLYRKFDETLPDRFTTIAEILKSQGYLTLGVTANPNLNKVTNFDQGFDHYVDSDVVWQWMKPEAGQTKYSSTAKLKSAPEVFNTAMDILNEDGRRPFFVFLHLMDVHKKMSTEINPEFESLFDNYARDEERTYYLKVRQVSSDIGNFVQNLTQQPGCEDTLFVLLADHGEGLFDHPKVPRSTWHGYYLYDSHVRIPLIFYHPNSRLKPRLVEQEVRLIDLMPTLLDYLGISRRSEDIVGKSLLPLIEGTEERIDLPEYFVAETRTNDLFKLAVYSKGWIYIENRDKSRGVNPRELQSRYGRQEGKRTDFIHKNPQIAAVMEKFLKEWETKFPEAAVTPSKKKASPETIEQLKSLGYIK